MARRRAQNQLVVIYWRDIPTHVNGVSGRDKYQFPMKKRFETAADRAAMKSGRNDANGYIAEVRRESFPAGDDPEAEAEALAAELDERFTLDVLNTFVENGGFDPAKPTTEGPDPTDPERIAQ